MPFFTTAPAARSDSTGTTGSTKVAASTMRSASVRSPPRPADRRVGQEQLVELALELGREVARGPAQAHLLFDLGHDLGHVGLRVVRHPPPPSTASARAPPSSALAHRPVRSDT